MQDQQTACSELKRNAKAILNFERHSLKSGMAMTTDKAEATEECEQHLVFQP